MSPDRTWLRAVVVESGNLPEGTTRHETLAATEPDAWCIGPAHQESAHRTLNDSQIRAITGESL